MDLPQKADWKHKVALEETELHVFSTFLSFPKFLFALMQLTVEKEAISLH